MAHSVAAPAAIVAPAVPASNTSALLASLPADPNSKRLLMSNIPVVLAEDQVKELVQPFGDLKNFTLLKDNVTGASTGNALFEYQDDSAADEALQGLNDLDIGGIPLSVRRAPQDASAVDETSVVVKLVRSYLLLSTSGCLFLTLTYSLSVFSVCSTRLTWCP
jgi:splicing factor U2AF subunit